MWLPAHLADVESDLSAFHRVDRIDDLSAPRFFQLVWRLPHYRGVMRDRVIALQREQDEQGSTPQASAAPARGERPVAARRPPAARAEPVTEAVLADPVMSKIFSFG
jgi:hypothetical protein